MMQAIINPIRKPMIGTTCTIGPNASQHKQAPEEDGESQALHSMVTLEGPLL